MHPLLKRQLKRIGLDEATTPPSLDSWQQLLERVSQSYVESDQGRELLERSIALSSHEMQELNEQLRRTSESRLAGERDKLQTVLRSIGDGLCVVCLLYTSDAADERSSVDLGGRRIIKKKTNVLCHTLQHTTEHGQKQ